MRLNNEDIPVKYGLSFGYKESVQSRAKVITSGVVGGGGGGGGGLGGGGGGLGGGGGCLLALPGLEAKVAPEESLGGR